LYFLKGKEDAHAYGSAEGGIGRCAEGRPLEIGSPAAYRGRLKERNNTTEERKEGGEVLGE